MVKQQAMSQTISKQDKLGQAVNTDLRVRNRIETKGDNNNKQLGNVRTQGKLSICVTKNK